MQELETSDKCEKVIMGTTPERDRGVMGRQERKGIFLLPISTDHLILRLLIITLFYLGREGFYVL